MGILFKNTKDLIENNTNFESDTTVMHIRVSEEEKTYLNTMAEMHGENISAFVRRLIFDVYRNDLSKDKTFFIEKYLFSKWAFNTNRTTSIHIRLTDREKNTLTKLAKAHNRTVSSFVRWVALQVYLDDFIITS